MHIYVENISVKYEIRVKKLILENLGYNLEEGQKRNRGKREYIWMVYLSPPPPPIKKSPVRPEKGSKKGKREPKIGTFRMHTKHLLGGGGCAHISMLALGRMYDFPQGDEPLLYTPTATDRP